MKTRRKTRRPSLGAILAAACLTLSVVTVVAGCASGDVKKVQDGLQAAGQALNEASKAVNTAAAVVNQAQAFGQKVQGVADSVVHDQQVLVEKGDTLWGLASKAYHGLPQAPLGEGGYLWPLICERNSLENCNVIEPGQVIRLVPASALDTVPLQQVAWAIQAAYIAPNVRK